MTPTTVKDLLVYTADADALGFMRGLMSRPRALGIRPIDFAIERHPQRDAGMVQSGAELARLRKRMYAKALLMWDHHGSGRDHKQSPDEVAADVKAKLDAVTWSGNSAVAVLVPELEQWLWFCESAVASHCSITPEQLRAWVQDRADKLTLPMAKLIEEQPKELFEYIMRDRLRRTISPRDFEEIGKRASVTSLQKCDSFASIVRTLHGWFPR